MGRETSIAISIHDNYTQALTTIRNATSAFNKDLDGTQKKLDALTRTKATLKIDVDAAKKELKEAQKQFEATGDAADRLKLEMANANYDNAKANLDLVTKSAKQAQQEMNNLTGVVSKAENRAGMGAGMTGKSSSSSNSSIGGALKNFAASGILQMVGDSALQIVGTYATSALGQQGGNLVGNALGGAVSGAAMGAIAGPIGAAVGGLIGGITGLLSGQAQNFEQEDEYFKSQVKDQVTDAQEVQQSQLESGIQIAGDREQMAISFDTLLKGKTDKSGQAYTAEKYMDEMKDFAAKTPFTFDNLSNMSKTLFAYGYDPKELLGEDGLLQKVGDAGSALGMSEEDMNWVATSLGRMKTTGKTTLEYLNPLLERGIPVWDYLAKASGKTKEEVQEMVSDGLVPGEEAAEAIADYMGDSFAGNMEKQAKTYQGLLSTLEDLQDAEDAAVGEGYTEERKKGLEAEIAYKEKNADTIAETNKYIGQWQASLDNQKEEIERSIRGSIEGGKIISYDGMSDTARTELDRLTQEYQHWKDEEEKGNEEAGAHLGKVMAEAQILAQNEYNQTEGAQLQYEIQKQLAEDVGTMLAENQDYWRLGWECMNEFNKGIAARGVDKEKFSTAEENKKVVEESAKSSIDVYEEEHGKNGISAMARAYYRENLQSHATGLFRVPYNNYPALLHEGETVLTGAESRSLKTGPNVNITGNQFIIREEADIDKIAAAFVSKFQQAMALQQ